MSKKDGAARKPAGAPTLTAAWAAVVLALLLLVFFREVALEGRTFISPDTTAPAGFVRVGEESLWKDHVYPLWNPYVFLGMPSFGSGAYNPLIYPPDWPVALLQRFLPLPDLTWMLLYYFLGGLGMFLLAREWKARPEGALLAAAAFVFQPNLVAVGSHGHGSQLVDSAYLPLMLWLSTRWLRRGSLMELGWLALAGGFQLLRGHVQVCFYTWIAIALHSVAVLALSAGDRTALRDRLVRVVGVVVAAGLAFGVAGLYNLPLRDYAQHSIRGAAAGGGVAFSYATSWSMAAYELPSLVFPNFVGFGGASYWGGMPFTDYPNGFIGAVVFALALIGFASRMGDPAARLSSGVLALFALFVCMGSHSPLYQFLYDHLPLFNKFRVPVMAILLFQVPMAMGAAWGWGALVDGAKGPRDASDRLLLGLGLAFAVLLGVGMLGSEGLRAGYVTNAVTLKPEIGIEGARAAFEMFKGDLLRVPLFGLVLVALAWFMRRGALAVGVASVAVLGLLLVELWPVSRQTMAGTIGDPVARDLDYGRDDVIRFLEQAGPQGSFRAFFPQDFQSNRPAGFRIASLGGYHAAKPRLYQDLVETNAIMKMPWLALLNARYWVFSRPISPTDFPPQWLAALRMVYEGDGGVVYEYAYAMPRATLVGAWSVVPDTGRAVVDSISVAVQPPALFTYLTQDPGIPSGALEPVGNATIAKYGLHEVEVEVEASRAAVLRLADLWYPDWKVSVDGKPATLLRADHLLRAVAVPAGRHTVRFTYASSAFTLGAWVSALSVVLALLLMLGGGFRARLTRKPSEGAAA